MNKSSKDNFKVLSKTSNKTKLIMKNTIPEKHQMMCGKYAYEDTFIACGYSDGVVRVYNVNTQNKINQIHTYSNNEKTPVNSLRWRPIGGDLGSVSSVLLIANTDGYLYQYAAKTGQKLYEGVEENNYISAVDYAKDGRQFATGGKDNAIRVYDEEKKIIKTKLQSVKWHSQGHNNRIFCLKFSPDDPNILLSGGWDQNIYIWDLREGQPVSTICGPRIAGDSIDIRGQTILTGSNRSKDQLELWDMKTSKVVSRFRWDAEQEQTNSFVFCSQFSKNMKGTIIGVGGNKMKIFDIENGQQLYQVVLEQSASLYVCDSGHSLNRFFIGGDTGTLYNLMSTKSYN